MPFFTASKTQATPFAELKSEVLRIETLVIVSSPEHHLAKQPALSIRDLSGQTILLPKHDCSYKMIFEQALTEQKVSPATFIELNSLESIKKCVLRGVGVAMVPLMSIKKEIAQEKITILPWQEERLETAVLMIWHKDKWVSPTLQAFMDTTREVMKNHDSN